MHIRSTSSYEQAWVDYSQFAHLWPRPSMRPSDLDFMTDGKTAETAPFAVHNRDTGHVLVGDWKSRGELFSSAQCELYQALVNAGQGKIMAFRAEVDIENHRVAKVYLVRVYRYGQPPTTHDIDLAGLERFFATWGRDGIGELPLALPMRPGPPRPQDVR